MTAGIPGTGIGGLFYVVQALIAPLSRSTRAHSARGIAALAYGVLAGILGTGWLLGYLFAPATGPASITVAPSFLHRAETENIVRWASLLGSIVLLGIVLLSVQVARLIQRLRWKK